jgi:hypothetical protein
LQRTVRCAARRWTGALDGNEATESMERPRTRYAKSSDINIAYQRSAEKLGGIAVHIGAGVMAQAQPGEVLVSSTVRDLVSGSGLTFTERGSHALKGIPGEWELYAVA